MVDAIAKKIRNPAAVLICFYRALGNVASAQVLNSGAQTIALNATLAESLTVGLSANAVTSP
jgi:hypothetical protein